jgi:hypothetical protein
MHGGIFSDLDLKGNHNAETTVHRRGPEINALPKAKSAHGFRTNNFMAPDLIR